MHWYQMEDLHHDIFCPNWDQNPYRGGLKLQSVPIWLRGIPKEASTRISNSIIFIVFQVQSIIYEYILQMLIENFFYSIISVSFLFFDFLLNLLYYFGRLFVVWLDPQLGSPLSLPHWSLPTLSHLCFLHFSSLCL